MSTFKKLSTKVFTLSLLIAAFACTPALADPVVQITQCGTVITQPGHYILANDLFCGLPVSPDSHMNNGPMSMSDMRTAAVTMFSSDPPSTNDGIDIVSDHIDLSLNGHTISGGFNAGAFGITVAFGVAAGNSHVHITGPGTITGWGAAVVFFQVSHSSLSDVTATDNFIDFALVDGSVNGGCAQPCPPTKNDFQGNTGNTSQPTFFSMAGFFLLGANDNTVRDNNISNAVDGIVVLAGTGNDVRANAATVNFLGIGVALGATDNDITHNTAQNNGLDLDDENPNCDSNTWKHNTFGTANQPCIN
jgi:parallel beta-helix repeat protein